jgi:hypothetical protein
MVVGWLVRLKATGSKFDPTTKADTARLGLVQGMTVTDRPPPEIRGNRRQISFVVLLHT